MFFILETEQFQFRACVLGGSMFLAPFLELKTAELGREHLVNFERSPEIYLVIRDHKVFYDQGRMLMTFQNDS